MVKKWTTEPAVDFTCKPCGSVYSVAIKRFPLRDSDKAYCEVCGGLLKKWNDTEVPVFTLKTRGTPPADAAA